MQAQEEYNMVYRALREQAISITVGRGKQFH